MIGKLCRGGKKRVGARALVEYLIGYAVAEKGASQDEIAEALDRVFAEAETRDDRGVNTIWSPEAGAGTRPSSILVRNCPALIEASIVMDVEAAGNAGASRAAMHFVWSWSTRESGWLTDEQAHAYVEEVLDKLGLDDHRYVSVVHRDTIVYERDLEGQIARDEQGNAIVRDGNLHVHCAVGTVNPHTGLVYDRTGIYSRMAWAEREVELAHGLEHDHGLAVVQDAGLATEHVRWADAYELAAWRAERQEERLVRQELRSFEAYRQRDQTFDNYADKTIGPRLQTALDLARDRSVGPDWATLHTVSARLGASLERDEEGRVLLRDVGVGHLRFEHDRERTELRRELKRQKIDAAEIDEQLAEKRAEHTRIEMAERDRLRLSGPTVVLATVLYDDLRDLPAFQNVPESELALIARVEEQPHLVLRNVTAQVSTFTRADVDSWLGARISDPEALERLGDLVVRDPSVCVLAVDTVQPLMSTTEVIAIERELATDARALAQAPSGITHAQIARAIDTYEREETLRRDTFFALSDEQHAALTLLPRGSLITIEGLPGTGKTTIQGVVRVLGEQTGRDVVGLALSQTAAEKLEAETGFRTFNIARARIMEEHGHPVIPHNGIVVVDEGAMVDSRAAAHILALAHERGNIVVEVGDLRQLQPIDFGASFRIIRAASQAADAYAELRDIQRQKHDWHREAVEILADAIVERDERKRETMIASALGILDRNGAITWTDTRDQAIDEAITRAQAQIAAQRDTLTLAADKDTVRHLAEEQRRRQGLEGAGLHYQTDGGTREFAVGDQLMFLENSLGKKGIGVRNGDRGTVLETHKDRIIVELDGQNQRTVTFDPAAYKGFDYASARVIHKAQGASVDSAVAVIDRSASAELVFVAASRSAEALDLVVPRSAFEDLRELAEHVAEHTQLKTTSETFDELLERTGGPETMRVLNIEAQRAAEPMRRLYDAEVTEPHRVLAAIRVAGVREAYNTELEAISLSDLSLEERLRRERDAQRSMRTGLLAAHHDSRPLPFGAWLKEQAVSRENVADAHGLRELDQTQARDHTETRRWSENGSYQDESQMPDLGDYLSR